MQVFQTDYQPVDWDMVSHRSDGEYFSLSEVSEISSDEGESSLAESPRLSSSDFDTSSALINFLDIKMMTSFVDLNSLIRQRDEIQSKMPVLTPGQFFLYDYYASQHDQLNSQIHAIQQPSVVNIHNYTPTDAEFVQPSKPPSPQIPAKLPDKGKALIKYEHKEQDDSLENSIFILEEEIKEK